MKAQVEKYDTLPEGTYPATFAAIEPMSNESGTFWKWGFDTTYEGEAHRITATSSPRLTRKTKAGEWVQTLIGRQLDPGEDFDFDTIVGNPCQLVLIIHDADSGEYNRVDRVLAAKPELVTQLSADDTPF